MMHLFNVELVLLLITFMSSYLLAVFDAVGKLPPGVLKGDFNWLGNYKECISTEFVPGVNDTRHGFSSHYCPVSLQVPQTVSSPVCTITWIFKKCPGDQSFAR